MAGSFLLRVCCAAVVAGIAANAQSRSLLADLGKYAFEVASVRPSADNTGASFGSPQRGRFHVTGVTLHAMIAGAYGGLAGPLADDHIIGGPGWIRSDRWDIVAKAQENNGGFQPMLKAMQTLLRDRFHLKLHTEQRPLPVYHLVLAKGRAKARAKLRPSKTNCAAAFQKEDETGEWPKDLWCGIRRQRGVPTKLVAKGVTLAEFARELQMFPGLDRPVIDRTGWKGTFDFEAEYSPIGTGDAAQAEQLGATIFTALQEQLGLKLESARGQVEILVINSVDKPEEN
jgi:uncharacterized protein (TIGR03435 family)